MEKRADLNALLIFATVVESNSFSVASRRLRMPVSTVSRRIAELESDLGVRLLHRSTRRQLGLTDIGVEVFAQARLAVDVNNAIAVSLPIRTPTFEARCASPRHRASRTRCLPQ